MRTAENVKMNADVSTETAPQFDPAGEVPDEYDVFCESCGYSLAGLSNDRCPECGAKFERKELPFARIPWLHRRRLGTVKAYLRTVGLVCFMPGRFARELCRPVRVSAADARKFRMATIRLLTLLAAAGAVELSVARAATLYRVSLFMPAIARTVVTDSILTVVAIAAWVVAFHVFLRLATDMPLFIWKGHPSLRPDELSPVHQYACAPLMLAPPFLGLSVLFAYLGDSSVLDQRLMYFVLAGLAAAVVPVWLWGVALRLMYVSGGRNVKRTVLMAAYLPVHWVLMFSLSHMLWLLFVVLEQTAMRVLHVHSMLFR